MWQTNSDTESCVIYFFYSSCLEYMDSDGDGINDADDEDDDNDGIEDDGKH